jgi:hypothetical protein
MIVHKQETRSGIAGDKNIRPAIFVEISRDDCHPVAFSRFCDPSLLADVDKSTVAIVSIQRMYSSGQSDRATFHGDAFPVAIWVFSWHRRVFEGETHVI